MTRVFFLITCKMPMNFLRLFIYRIGRSSFNLVWSEIRYLNVVIFFFFNLFARSKKYILILNSLEEYCKFCITLKKVGVIFPNPKLKAILIYI